MHCDKGRGVSLRRCRTPGSFLGIMILNAMLALHCGSMSITSTLRSLSTKAPARFIAVVVLPTPPLWLDKAMERVKRAGGIGVTFPVFLVAISIHPCSPGRYVPSTMIKPVKRNYKKGFAQAV